jgi:hypothetical protein
MSSLAGGESIEIPDQTAKSAGLRPVEAWYVAYALLGVVAAGLVPVMLPLTVSMTGLHAAGAGPV